MQTDIRITCCEAHLVKDIQGYCNDCGKPFCKECVLEHIGHKMMKIEDFCEEKKISIYKLAAQLEEKRKRMIEITTKLKGPMEYSVALFIAEREGFFKEKACINCSIDGYCACEGADILFDIEGVMKKELVDVGEGVKMTEPIEVKKRLMTGNCIYASLSHNGILAIGANWDEVQFTDLNANRQMYMDVETSSLAAFYDNMVLLLTYGEPLREATVEEVFSNPRIETFKEIEGTSDVDPFTDVSLLHEQRVLYYRTRDNKMFSFNVDTRENIEIDLGRRIALIPSLTGVDCGIKVMFQDSDDRCTYTLNNDNTIIKVNEKQCYDLRTLFPSTSNPRNIKNAVFEYDGHLIKDGKKLDTRKLIAFNPNYSVIRVYRDVFLALDWDTLSWVLLRIIVS